MRRILVLLVFFVHAAAAQEEQQPKTFVIDRPAAPFFDALGRAMDPPVCCQFGDACSPGSDGITSAELRSLCVAADGQPLTGQFCHRDGQCRP